MNPILIASMFSDIAGIFRTIIFQIFQAPLTFLSMSPSCLFQHLNLFILHAFVSFLTKLQM